MRNQLVPTAVRLRTSCHDHYSSRRLRHGRCRRSRLASERHLPAVSGRSLATRLARHITKRVRSVRTGSIAPKAHIQADRDSLDVRFTPFRRCHVRPSSNLRPAGIAAERSLLLVQHEARIEHGGEPAHLKS